jgi:prepilin-type processing-associated H-X9-DG protein
MKTLECASNLRAIGFEFSLFANGDAGEAGRTNVPSGSTRFHINDFQDYVYRINAYWDAPGSTATLRRGTTTAMCPAGPATLTKHAGFPCSAAAIGPEEGVTLAANMRLFRAEVAFAGRVVLAPAAATRVSTRILQRPYTPLFMEVDGEAAAARDIAPFYIAPPLLGVPETPYGRGTYWMPADRHAGGVNVVFVGGHVLSSAQPEQEAWDWSYQAEVGR